MLKALSASAQSVETDLPGLKARSNPATTAIFEPAVGTMPSDSPVRGQP